MTTARQHAQYRATEAALEARGFSRMHFDLNKVKSLLNLLGDPQRAYRAIHVTGTNGKTSTARMIESLIRAHGLRTGRYTSPHLDAVRERVTIDGEAISEEQFQALYEEVAPLAAIVDAEYDEPLTYFDMTTALALAGFADAPVDVAVVEVGLGGETDSTNVLNAEVAVVMPVGLDHTQWLGETIGEIASMKAGIIHKGSTLVTAKQDEEAMIPLVQRCHQVGANLIAEGRRYAIDERRLAVGGQLLTITGPSGATYEDIYLPLHGEHQAQNAAAALSAVEVLLGAGEPKPLNGDVVAEGFAKATSPGRLERVHTEPTVLIDAAHNPTGMEATAKAITDEFAFQKLIAVVGVFGDKDAHGMLTHLHDVCDDIIVTQASFERAMPAGVLAEIVGDLFEPSQITVIPKLADALDTAIRFAEEGEASFGSAGVLVTGSVYTVAEARRLLIKRDA